MNYTAFVGTYTNQASEGIYTCDITVDGSVQLTRTQLTAHQENPTFLAVHPKEPFLYAVHEVDDGAVTAYQIQSDGALVKQNQHRTGAAGPCYCSVHPSGEYLFVAHYSGSAVSMLPIQEQGTVCPPSEIIVHEGSGRNPERQTQPHPHSAVVSPNGRFLYIADLGTDQVVIYEIEPETDSLRQTESVDTQPGAGPRHIAFHPAKPYLYLINELDSTISAFKWNPASGAITQLDVISTLPPTYNGANQTSEIQVHPSGQWVYGCNRGHDSIASFLVQDDGSLRLQEIVSTEGEWPRYFAIDPSGKLFLVENRYSDDIIPFRINEATGTLTQAGSKLELPEPACLVFRKE